MTAKANSDIHDNELEWFLLEADHAIGNRSWFEAFVATLERNGGHCDWDANCSLLNLHLTFVLGRYRAAWGAWLLTPAEHRRILLAHYIGRRNSNVGAAPQKPVRGKLVLVEKLDSDLQQALARAGPDALMIPTDDGPPLVNGCIAGESWQRWPMGVAGQLGEVAGVALQLAADADDLRAATGEPMHGPELPPGRGALASLLQACRRGQSEPVRRAAAWARRAVADAHYAWREAERRARAARAREWRRAS